MKLSLKQKALLQSLGILILSIFAGVTITTILSKIPAEAIPYIAMAGLFGIALNLLYSLNLSRLEFKEKMDKIKKG